MKEFEKLFSELSYRHQHSQVFSDFLAATVAVFSFGRQETEYLGSYSDTPKKRFRCLENFSIGNTGDACCFINNFPTRQYSIATNKNPDKIVVATILQEKWHEESHQWLSEKYLMQSIAPGKSIQLPECPYTYLPNPSLCVPDRRYSCVAACFKDDPQCDNQEPDNSDMSSFNCKDLCNGNSQSCINIQNKFLSPDQLATSLELYNSLTNDKEYEFVSDFVKVFLPNPQDPHCLGRKTVRHKSSGHIPGSLVSIGLECQLRPLLPEALQLLGSNPVETYRKLWISVPEEINGQISTKNKLLLDNKFGRGITVTIQLESGTIRNDFIRSITADVANNQLIISGDIICMIIHLKDV
jgi:hypothetical protein